MQFTTPARRAFARAIQVLEGKQRERFTSELREIYDRKITGEVELPEFKITMDDIELVLIEKCGVKRTQLVINP